MERFVEVAILNPCAKASTRGAIGDGRVRLPVGRRGAAQATPGHSFDSGPGQMKAPPGLEPGGSHYLHPDERIIEGEDAVDGSRSEQRQATVLIHLDATTLLCDAAVSRASDDRDRHHRAAS
jgi:hypothetical protein